MVVGLKDIFKLIGIIFISACAVFVCTLFMNFDIDIKGVKDQLNSETMLDLYNAMVMSGKVVCLLCGGCLLLTSVVLLCFYIKHYIDTHRRELGILKAMGYSDIRIARGFWVFGFSVFIGTAIGYAGAHCTMPLFYSTQNKDNIIPEVIFHFHPSLMIWLIILPSLLFAVLSVLYGYKKMGTPVLNLLRGKDTQKVKTFKKESDIPFLKEMKKNTIKQRKSLVFFIAFASFCYSDMIQMACSMNELSSLLMGVIIMMIGIILAAVTLLLAVTTVVKSNRKTVAMMKVFGYSIGECTGAVLYGYRPIAYIGFAIGTVYQYALLKIMVSIVFKDVANIPEYNFDVPVFILTLISFAVLYELIMYWYSRKMNKISIKEIMLDSD
jgi:predicted lysophospholipase L1 biosynthesis ABC-type transport system permease subunit